MVSLEVLILIAVILLLGSASVIAVVLAFWFGSYGARRSPRVIRARH